MALLILVMVSMCAGSVVVFRAFDKVDEEAQPQALPVTDSDRALLIDVKDIAPYTRATLNFDPDKVTISKMVFPTGGKELMLDYKHERQHMIVRVYQDKYKDNLKYDYDSEWTSSISGKNASVKLVDKMTEEHLVSELGGISGKNASVKLVDRFDYKCCHKSRLGDLIYEEQREGTVFVAMEGSLVYSIYMASFHIEDLKDLEHIMEQPLKAIRQGKRL